MLAETEGGALLGGYNPSGNEGKTMFALFFVHLVSRNQTASNELFSSFFLACLPNLFHCGIYENLSVQKSYGSIFFFFVFYIDSI